MAQITIDPFPDAFLFLALPALLVLMQKKKKNSVGKKVRKKKYKRRVFPTLKNENTMIFQCAKSNSFVKIVDSLS